MKNHSRRILLLVIMFAMTSPSLAFAVDAEPRSLLINTLGSVAVVQLSHQGQPLAPADFKGAKLMVDDSNYARMISVTAIEGGVRVAPTPAMEVGTYMLVIETSKGPAYVTVNAPLAGETGILEERTQALDGARDEAMRDIGLATELPRGQVQFTLPPRYLVGQALRLSAPAAPGVRYRWSVNGQPVSEGLEFVYVFPGEGDYTVMLEQGGGNSAWTKSSESTTLVEEPPATSFTAKAGQRVTFSAPDGYASYAWNLDGKPMGSSRTLGLAFPQPGNYVLRCRCEGQPDAAPGSFHTVRYEITVP